MNIIGLKKNKNSKEKSIQQEKKLILLVIIRGKALSKRGEKNSNVQFNSVFLVIFIKID